MAPTQRHEFHFVCRQLGKWPELDPSAPLSAENAAGLPDPEQVFERITSAEDCWIVQTYLHLRAAGVAASISSGFVPDAICLASGYETRIRDVTPETFVVACRGDAHDPALAQVSIVQNQGLLGRKHVFFVPHWPQPGLIPRDRGRGTRIINLAFKGDPINLDGAFSSPEFTAELARHGVALRISGKSRDGLARWHDYSDDDLVLAIRDLTEADARTKPASKLINAWHAGVPALLGPEPAFRELRRTGDDYIEIRTPADVIEAVRALQSDPHRYLAMVGNGERRARDYTVPKIRDRWLELLCGPVSDRFEAWRRSPVLLRSLGFPINCIRHKLNLRRAAWNREHGLRTVSGART